MWNLQHLALDLQGCLHGGKEGVQDWWIRAGPSGHLHAKSLVIVISTSQCSCLLACQIRKAALHVMRVSNFKGEAPASAQASPLRPMLRRHSAAQHHGIRRYYQRTGQERARVLQFTTTLQVTWCGSAPQGAGSAGQTAAGGSEVHQTQPRPGLAELLQLNPRE